MRIYYTDMLRMEEFRLPKLFMVSGYTVYFWSNENGEPIHVHLATVSNVAVSEIQQIIQQIILCLR